MKGEALRTAVLGCQSVADCLRVVTTDTLGEFEEAERWRACFGVLFARGTPAQVLGQAVTLERFALVNELCVLAVCRREQETAHVAPQSVAWTTVTPPQALWLEAWKQWCRGTRA